MNGATTQSLRREAATSFKELESDIEKKLNCLKSNFRFCLFFPRTIFDRENEKLNQQRKKVSVRVFGSRIVSFSCCFLKIA